jgi:anti-sigma factor RsiW
MSHLTDEQIEELLARPEAKDAHVADCPQCAQRMAQARAMRSRLRQAFEPVHADVILEHQVLAGVRSGQRSARPSRAALVFRRFLPPAAAVAAMLLVAVLVTLHVAGTPQAMAASAELTQIHQSNLMPHASLHGSSDPQHVAEYFRSELGFTPALPRLGAGMKMRGCCVAHFRDRPVGSYVVDTDRGVVSIIVLPDSPDSLEFAGSRTYGGRTYHTGSFARSKLAAFESGGYTYAAVGEVDTQWLVELLASLLVSG